MYFAYNITRVKPKELGAYIITCGKDPLILTDQEITQPSKPYDTQTKITGIIEFNTPLRKQKFYQVYAFST